MAKSVPDAPDNQREISDTTKDTTLAPEPGNDDQGVPDNLPIHTLAVVVQTSLWQPGQKVRVGFLDGTTDQQQYVKDTISQYWLNSQNKINLDFEYVDVSHADIRITFLTGGNNSEVGANATRTPSGPTSHLQRIANSKASEEDKRFTMCHEAGHMLGFVHELGNPDAPLWDQQKVFDMYAQSYRNSNPGISDRDIRNKINTQILHRYSRDTSMFSKFDDTSIMLYRMLASANPQGVEIPEPKQPSETDLDFARACYPWPQPTGAEYGKFDVRDFRAQVDMSGLARPIWNSTVVKRRQGRPPVEDSVLNILTGVSEIDMSIQDKRFAQVPRFGFSVYAERFKDESFVLHFDGVQCRKPDRSIFSTGVADYYDMVVRDRRRCIIGRKLVEEITSESHVVAIPFASMNYHYDSNPNVALFLGAFDVECKENWTIKLQLDELTESQMKVKIKNLNRKGLKSVAINWIAFAKGNQIAEGHVDDLAMTKDKRVQSGRVSFPKAVFTSNQTPVIMTGFCELCK